MAQNLTAHTLTFVREAEWLDSARAVNYCRILAAITFVTILGWIALSHNGLDPSGKPLGTDFLSFWAASKLALSGHPAAVYNVATHYAEQQTTFLGAPIKYSAFFYPPVYLLICLPLAMLPYLASVSLWLAATGYAYWRVVHEFLGEIGTGAWLPILAFPAVVSNAGHGQNAFLTTALIGGGVLAMRKHQVLAGICFGALIFKPHLGVLIPVLLIAGGRWKTALAAGCTACALIATSVAVLGVETWRAFLHTLPLAREALEQEMVGSAKMESVFAAVRLWHGNLGTAYALQAVAGTTACVLLFILARREPKNGAEGPALIAATFLTSPFLLDYDLTLLAIPLAWVFSQAQRGGFMSWEKTVLMLGFALPALSRAVATDFGLPLGPPIVFALLIVVLRRGFLSSEDTTTYETQAGVQPAFATRD